MFFYNGQRYLRSSILHANHVTLCNVLNMFCGNRCDKPKLILLRAMLLATKMLPDFMMVKHVTPWNF